MTGIGIVGGGRAATLHAEAIRAVRGVRLVGVAGRRSGSVAALTAAVGTEDLPLDELVERTDAVVVAVPPAAVREVVAAIPADRVVLVESPVGMPGDPPLGHPSTLTGANLLHAPLVRQGLDAVRGLGEFHHLTLRMSVPRPHWGEHGTARFGGVMLDPGAQVLPVLLAAAGEPVTGLNAQLTSVDEETDLAHHARLELILASQRRISADLTWTDGPAQANLEAASVDRVVSLDLWPVPVLEIDGRQTAGHRDVPALAALGFVAQVERLAAIARGDRVLWPEIGVGEGVLRLAAAALVAHETGRFCRLD